MNALQAQAWFDPGVTPPRTMNETEKPTITEKELSWKEAVAMHLARQDFLSKQNIEATQVGQILTLPRQEPQTVGSLSLMPYSLAHSLAFDALKHPIEVGGPVSTADLIVAAITFSNVGLVEDLLNEHGPEKARALLWGHECQQVNARAIDRATLTAFGNWMRRQLGLVDAATGGETGATPGK